MEIFVQEVNVITPYNLNVPYTYLCNKNFNPKPGNLVVVEVRNVVTYGLLVEDIHTNYSKKLKQVISKIDHITISSNVTKFIQWCAYYNMVSLGAILKMMFPIPEIILNKSDLNEIDNYIYNIHKSNMFLDKLSKSEKKLLSIFKKNIHLDTNSIKTFKVKSEYLNSLIEKKIIISSKKVVTSTKYEQEKINTSLSTVLNIEQQQACDQLNKILAQNKFSVSLLDGIPGSGKTEVYFELISEVIKQNKAVLVLLPEIALSNQWISRFKNTFSVLPYIWHSNISKKEKKIIYSDLINRKVKVLVGTRSALFLPYPNLGLIIIDEEHDTSFKQEDKVIYNARDMSIARAYFENIPVLLSTATPSVETWYNYSIGKYNYFQLTKRFNKYSMPSIELVDMNIASIVKGENLSSYLLNKLISNFNNKKQSLLFLNKRGYSNLNICTNCKNKIICPKCSHGEDNIVYLIAHKSSKKFICHRCSFWQYLTSDCKLCGAKNSILSYGLGIEKLAEEVQEKIPSARITLASSDTINNSRKAQDLINNILENKVDIIIGTQILAKGYHFPNLNLVGIVDAGLESNTIDLKCYERIWQVLYQVAGRAGRESTKGEVILQSYSNNYLIQTIVNFKRNEFLVKELTERLENNLPPYSRLASIIVTSKNEKKLKEIVIQLKKNINLLPKEYRNYIKGPEPALFYKINLKYRYRFLVTSSKKFILQRLITLWLSTCKIPSSVHVKIDIDPISFY